MTGSQIAPLPIDADLGAVRKAINDILAVLNGDMPHPLNMAGDGTITGNLTLSGTVDIPNLVRPAARVTHGANQEVTTDTDHYVLLNSESGALGCFDNDNIHDTVTHISRLTCKTAGTYLIFGNIWWSESAVGSRYLAIERARTVVLAAVKQAAHGIDRQFVATVHALAVNDYVELMARQDTGGSLDITVLGNTSPVFGMVKLF